MSWIWTDDTAAMALRMWKDGKSASEIARHLHNGYGPSRNAVIGKVSRMAPDLRRGMARPSAPPVRKVFAAKPPPPVKTHGFGRGLAWGKKGEVATKPPSPLPSAKLASASEPKHWAERRRFECCWPVSGSGADTMSCCAPGRHHTSGGSYCDDHWKLRNTKATGWVSDRSMEHALMRARAA